MLPTPSPKNPPSFPVRYNRSSSGLTLTELLVVIGIIGALCLLLLPVVGSFKQKGRDTKCLSNLRQVAAGMLMYAGENEGSLPAAIGDNIAGPQMWTTWIRKIVPYIPSKLEGRGDASDILSCPAKPANTGHTATYAINSYMIAQYNGYPTPPGRWSYKLNRVPNPSKTIMVGEMQPRNVDALATSDKKSFFGNQGYGPGFRHGSSSSATVEKRSKANMAFCDGHVEALTFDQLLLNPPDLASNPVESRSLWKWW